MELLSDELISQIGYHCESTNLVALRATCKVNAKCCASSYEFTEWLIKFMSPVKALSISWKKQLGIASYLRIIQHGTQVKEPYHLLYKVCSLGIACIIPIFKDIIPTMKTKLQVSLLNIVCALGHVHILEELANVILGHVFSDMLILIACSKGHTHIVRHVLNIPGVSLNPCAFACIAFRIACTTGDIDLVQQLLQRDHYRPKIIKAGFDVACQYGHTDVVHLILGQFPGIEITYAVIEKALASRKATMMRTILEHANDKRQVVPIAARLLKTVLPWPMRQVILGFVLQFGRRPKM
jgi:hypothetical protein